MRSLDRDHPPTNSQQRINTFIRIGQYQPNTQTKNLWCLKHTQIDTVMLRKHGLVKEFFIRCNKVVYLPSYHNLDPAITATKIYSVLEPVSDRDNQPGEHFALYRFCVWDSNLSALDTHKGGAPPGTKSIAPPYGFDAQHNTDGVNPILPTPCSLSAVNHRYIGLNGPQNRPNAIEC